MKEGTAPANGQRPPALLAPVLMAGMVSQLLLFSTIIPALPAIAAMNGVHGALIAQFSIALSSLGLVLAGLVAGGLIERLGVRQAILGAMIAFIVFGSLPVLFDGPVALLGSRLLAGIACGIVSTAATVLLAAHYHGDARGRMIGYQIATGSAGGLVMLLASGWIAAHGDWHLCFLLYGLTMLLFLVPAVIAVPPTAAATQEAVGGSVLSTLKLMGPLYLVACLLFMVPVLSGAYLPFLLGAHGTTDPSTQSVVIGLTSLGSAGGGFVFGRLASRIGAPRCYALALALGGVGMLTMAIGRSAQIVGAGSLLTGLGIGLYMPYLWLVATAKPPEALRARALALMSTAMFLGGFLYPVLFQPLAAMTGLEGAFAAVGVALGLSALAATMLSVRARAAATV